MHVETHTSLTRKTLPDKCPCGEYWVQTYWYGELLLIKCAKGHGPLHWLQEKEIVMNKVEVDTSDLRKIRDNLENNRDFHVARDTMNAELHLSDNIRYSPLTSETEATYERVENLLEKSVS